MHAMSNNSNCSWFSGELRWMCERKRRKLATGKEMKEKKEKRDTIEWFASENEERKKKERVLRPESGSAFALFFAG